MSSQNIGVEPARQGSLLRKILVILTPILIIVGFILIVVVLQALKPKPEVTKRGTPTLAVMATQAKSDNVQLSVTVQGETQPRTEIDLVPEVAGKITYVSPKFLSGGLFAKGDVLYRIDKADYQVNVVRAEASVARAQQVLVRERAESEIARKDWEDLGDGPASDLTLRKPQLLEAEAGLQSMMADLENAKIRLGRTYVRAPFAGRVREKFADLGQYVSPGSRLGRIFSTDIAEVRLALSDADLARLDIPVAYVAESIDAAPDVLITGIIGGQMREWSGKIMRTDSSYDTQTRSLFAIAEVVDPYGKGVAEGGYPLAPGLYVDASISGKRLENVIIIPRDGLRPENKVYVVDSEGVAESRSPIVLDASPERAVLASGIEPGELVILSPLEKSQISLKFKVLDINDPTTVLVEPKIEKFDEDGETDDEGKSEDGDKTELAEKDDGKKKERGKKNSENSQGVDQ
jgi:RND family efflux transporter MFP subunit